MPLMLDDAVFSRVLTESVARQMLGSVLRARPAFEPGPESELEVTEIRAASTQGRLKQFSVFFLRRHEVPLPQRTYVLQHPQLGDHALLLTAIGRTPLGVQYEACISHDVDA